MSSKIFSAAVFGLRAVTVDVEADIGRALPNIRLVGLPDAAVKEARERVRAAIKNCGLPFPKTLVTVNLAPGDVKKVGPLYDLPVALAILLAEGTLSPVDIIKNSIFVGELALDGRLRPVAGILAIALHAKEAGLKTLFVPYENAVEAALIEGVAVIGAPTLTAVVRHLLGETPLEEQPPTELDFNVDDTVTDFAVIQGQEQAKRACEIAAAGGHNVRLSGPPGAGKTLLARATAAILPPMTKDEVLEVTNIYSTAGLLGTRSIVASRPFRSPHHTASHVALVGGGSSPRPGEVSLAHRGVLFLDEFPEFPRYALEALRQPLEDGTVAVARAAGTYNFPARFMLVAAENPCPCGYATDIENLCTCTPSQLINYTRRISGPLLDRIDLHVQVPRLTVKELSRFSGQESSESVRARVISARERQLSRQEETGVMTNTELSSAQVRRCPLESAAEHLLQSAVERYHLSARAYYRALKLARTIADLDNEDVIQTKHVAEALQYRAEQSA